MTMTAPTRWRSDPSRRAAADLLLRAARRPQPPSSDDLARLSVMVWDIPRRAEVRRRLLTRLSAGVAVLALSAVLGTSVWAWRRAERGTGAASAGPAVCIQDPAPREAVRSVPSTTGPTAAVPRRSAPRKPRHPGPRAAVQPARAAQPLPHDSPDQLARETALIAAARADIALAPGAALATLDGHRREFPDGQLAPEREFLAVEALRRLNRTGEARERALGIARSFPASSYGARATRLAEVTR